MLQNIPFVQGEKRCPVRGLLTFVSQWCVCFQCNCRSTIPSPCPMEIERNFLFVEVLDYLF